VSYPPDPLVVASGKMGESVAAEADRLVSNERQQKYGHPLDDFTMTAELLNARFKDKLKIPFEPHEVAVIQRMVKESRLARSPQHRDSLVDLAGYAKTQDMVFEEIRRRHG
jgi:hypothetical protein